MKYKEADRLTKQKIESLGALEGGIVFGKEEAWEKLQARMDRQPARIWPIRYRMAAAAVLLMGMIAGSVFYFPAHEVSKKNIQAQPHEATKNYVVAPHPEVMAGQMQVPLKKNSVPVVAKKPQVKTTQAKEIMQPQNAVVAKVDTVGEANKAIVTLNEVEPVPPVKNEMKVVHINEVENGDANQPPIPAAVAVGGAIDISKMPVSHINSIEKQELQFKSILGEIRNSMVHKPFGRPVYYDASLNPEEAAQPHNLLKSILNLQN